MVPTSVSFVERLPRTLNGKVDVNALPVPDIWVKILSVPYRFLHPVILFLIGIGAYSLNNRIFEIFVVIVFGMLGYAMKMLDYPPVPLLFGFILGPMIEDHLRRALLIGHGNPMTLATSPLAAGFLLVSLLLVLMSSGGQIRTIGRWLKRVTATAESQ